jgi:NADH-quinone oxidoreductase subunit B
MSRPVQFNINPIPTDYKGHISVADMPDGHMGEGFFATKLSEVVGLARKNSIWPLPFATSCCGIEFITIWVALVLSDWPLLHASAI